MISSNQDNSLVEKTHKVQLLQSNVNRVYNQHQTLRHLLSETQIFIKIEQCIDNLVQAEERSQLLKQAVMNMKMEKDSADNGLKKQDQIRFKELNLQVFNIKQQLKRLKKTQTNNKRSKGQKQKKNVGEGKTILTKQLQEMNNNVNQYLGNIGKKLNCLHSQKIIENSKIKLTTQHNRRCENIEAQIGQLMCELQYIESENYKNIVKSRLQNNKISEQNQIGMLQRQIIVNQLSSFVEENQNRLTFEIELLFNQINTIIACFKSNQNKKHNHHHHNKNENVDYVKEVDKVMRRLSQVEEQWKGLERRKYLEREKIKDLDNKLIQLNPSVAPEHVKFMNKNPGIEGRLQECRLSLKEIKKLKHNYLYY